MALSVLHSPHLDCVAIFAQPAWVLGQAGKGSVTVTLQSAVAG